MNALKKIKLDKKVPSATKAAPNRRDFIIYSKKNYIYIGGGFLIVLLGYILMIGGGSDDPNVFNNAIFNFQRLTLSPVIILIGFIMVGIGIMSKGKQEEQKEE